MSSPIVRFRQMHGDDLDRVMHNEVRAYEFPWTRGVFLDCIRVGHECWLAEVDADVVGHAVLSCAAGEAHLLNICVAVEQQGQGFGRAMLGHLLGRAESRGAEAVFLEVRASNVVASELYESVGFNEIGRRRNYYPAGAGSEDARVLAMQLRLPS